MFWKFKKVPFIEVPFQRNLRATMSGVEFEVRKGVFDKLPDDEVITTSINGNQVSFTQAELIAYLYKGVKIPVEDWDKLSVNFLDGNEENIHPSNLVIKYPIKLECKDHPGFYYIPCFTGYGIDDEKHVVDLINRRIVSFWFTSRGYLRGGLKNDIDGRWENTLLHRIIGWVFKDYPINVDEMVINHIDNISDNNDEDNLEWVTSEENMKHAKEIGAYDKISYCFDVSDKETETSKEVYSINDLLKETGLTYSVIKPLLGSSSGLLDTRRYEIVVTNLNEMKERQEFFANMNKVTARIVLTGEEFNFDTYSETSKFFDIPIKTVIRYLRDKLQTPHDGVQFKRTADNVPWVNYNAGAAEIRSNGDTIPVEIRDVKTMEVKGFLSIVECAAYVGLTPGSVKSRLEDTEQRVYPEGYQYRYLLLRQPWREIDDLDSELSKFGIRQAVLLRNPETGEVKEFEMKGEAAKFLGLSAGSITSWLKKLNQPVHPKGWQIKLKSDPSPWRIPYKGELLKRTKSGKVVLVRNASTGEITEYGSGKECASALKINTTTLSYRLGNSPKLIYNGFQFKIATNPEDWV